MFGLLYWLTSLHALYLYMTAWGIVTMVWAGRMLYQLSGEVIFARLLTMSTFSIVTVLTLRMGDSVINFNVECTGLRTDKLSRDIDTIAT
eukprot:3923809-Karenia_brevis.AAC.1